MTDDRGEDNSLDAQLRAEVDAVVNDLYEPVPGAVVAAAKAAWTWRTVDAELAELLDEEPLAVRSATGGRSAVAYSAEGVVIDVAREGAIVLGQVGDLSGDTVGDALIVVVEVARPDGTHEVIEADVDGGGGFRVLVPGGPARVAVTLPAGRRIVTPWLPT